MVEHFVVCPHCNAGIGIRRVGETSIFYCSSCSKTFSAEGYCFGSERPP